MKRLFEFDSIGWGICLEYNLQDLWLGIFWKRRKHGKFDSSIDIWFCLIPCLPIHYWSGREKI